MTALDALTAQASHGFSITRSAIRQLHPFQDGNGRVTSALVTRHLVQHDHLPIVVTRDDRGDYIDALEAADDGNLTPLVDFTARQHRRSILQAMST